MPQPVGTRRQPSARRARRLRSRPGADHQHRAPITQIEGVPTAHAKPSRARCPASAATTSRRRLPALRRPVLPTHPLGDPRRPITAGPGAGRPQQSRPPLGDPGRPARAGRRGLALRRRQSQRERERERRVSDADASYNGPARSTRTLKHVIPQRNHANNNSLSIATRSLSQGPRQNKLVSTTKTDPKPTLCSSLTQAGRRDARECTRYLTLCQACVLKGR
jgi:hypothetical protein